jgi:dTDP-4-dehydrorhamnose reductase
VEDLAQALLEIIEKKLSGIYHVVGPDQLSKYDFGVRIAERFGLDPDLITPVSMNGLDRGAPRSLNLTLNSGKIEQALGHPLPGLTAGLDRFYERWQADYPQELQSYQA